MNSPIPINGQPPAAIEGRQIVISETTPGQWRLESNVPPMDVVCILLEIAKNAAVQGMKKQQSMIEVPEMKVTLQ